MIFWRSLDPLPEVDDLFYASGRKEDNLSKQKHKPKNLLAHYRKRMRFTQSQASRLAGCRNHSVIGNFEAGRVHPRLETVLKLGIIYRAPVEFLYHDLYEELRERIRKEEESMSVGQQDGFPLHSP